jgi:probable selenium-dependent hydroxylase accessory protein YqeC
LDWHSLKELLLLEERGVISLVGAGGKTTLMFALAKWIQDCGKRVITTTTTRIFAPTTSRSPVLVLREKPEDLQSECERLLKHYGHVTAGAGLLEDQNKIKGVAPDTISRLRESGTADWIIVEADGAAGRPLKAPAPHEPVIPAVTGHVIAVAGLSSIGLPLDETRVFRFQRYAALTGLAPGEKITASSVASALLHPEGIMRGAPCSARRFVFLNKAGREELGKMGREVAELVWKQGSAKLSRVFIGSAEEAPCRWSRLDTET